MRRVVTGVALAVVLPLLVLYAMPIGPGSSQASLLLMAAASVVLLVAMLLAPVVLARAVARRTGQDTGIATLLGFLLSWVGVLVVYLMSRSSRPYADPPATPRPWSPYGVPPAQPVSPLAAPGSRLRVLDRLRETGAISDEDYAAQRRSILETT